MGEITLNDIRDFMLWIIAFGGATFTIIKSVKKAIDSAFKPVNEKIDRLESKLTTKLEDVEISATKNYLVQTLAEIDRNGYIDGASRLRFYEQYQRYSNPKEKGGLGQNSYIHDEVERLKKAGKL